AEFSLTSPVRKPHRSQELRQTQKRGERGFSPTLSAAKRCTIEHKPAAVVYGVDRKSTRLNSSHVKISYAVFCLKKKKPQPAATLASDPERAIAGIGDIAKALAVGHDEIGADGGVAGARILRRLRAEQVKTRDGA